LTPKCINILRKEELKFKVREYGFLLKAKRGENTNP
jgi:hypothetical protein